MRGTQALVALMVITLLAGGAAAAPAVPMDAPDPDAGPRLPVPDVAGAAGAAAAGAADAAGAAGRALADAAHALASTLAAAASAVAHGAVTAAGALVSALAAAALAVVDAAIALARGVAAAVTLTLDALAAAARALGAAAAALASLAAAAAIATGALLANAVAALVAAFASVTEWFLGLEPRERAVVTTATGGAAAGAGLWTWLRRAGWLGALPLYSRLAKSEMLENPQRARIMTHVTAHAGAHPTAIADALGLGWGTVVYHLGRLERAGLVRAEKRGTVKCFFAVGGDLDMAGQRRVAALQNETARRVAAFVGAHPAATQKDVARALGMSAALVSWHVKRLTAADVLRVAREGRATRLFLADGVPARAVDAPAPPATAAAALSAQA